MSYNGKLIENIIQTVDKAMTGCLVKCPDCQFSVLAEELMPCPDCTHIACSECMREHVLEPHLSDYDNSPCAHGAWRHDA